MGKSKEKIRVSFPSASAEKVAGSQVLIQFGKGEERQQILVECGLIQGESTVLKEYQANSRRFAFKPKDLTAVFVCHAHSDHGSLCARLYKEGCTAPLIVPTHSKAILKEMWLDTAKIFLKDAEYLTRYFKKDYQPIYTEADVFQTLNYVQEYERKQKIKLNDQVEFEFIPSGHIISACQLILWIKNNGSIKKIVITSDLGNKSVKQYYIDDFEPIENANLLIGETTYCNKKRSSTPRDRIKDLEKMEAAINTVCKDQMGSILIPAFSLQRFQVLLTHLYDVFHKYDGDKEKECPEIIAASPLACRLSDLFDTEISKEEDREKWEAVKNWSKIVFVRDFETLDTLLKQMKPRVYVASGGMIQAGPSTAIAKFLLPKSNNMILFCGFMAENTLGCKIKEKKTKTVTIDGCQIKARCNVMSLNSFSSHITHDDMLWYYSSFCFDKICLVHGDMDDKILFARELQDEISKKNKSGKVVCVNKSTEICL